MAFHKRRGLCHTKENAPQKEMVQRGAERLYSACPYEGHIHMQLCNLTMIEQSIGSLS